jgi:maltose alpha-D-glucosyltransferase/alpha-amylase
MQPRYLINSPALSEIFQDARHLEELANSLAAFLENQRWFAAKTDGIQSVEILDSVEIPGEATAFELVLATVVTNGGSSDCYALPITSALQNDAQSADAIIAGLSSDDGSTASPTSLVECSSNPEFWRAITASLAARTLTTRDGRELKLSRTANSRLGSGEVFGNSEFTIHDGEQSNSAVAIGDDFFLKLFRRPRVGHNPDAEVGIFLTDRTDFRNSPRVDGTIDIVGPDGNRCIVLISEQVSAETDAWSYTLDNLKDYWTRLAELNDRPESPPQLDLMESGSVEIFLSEVEQLSGTLIGTFREEAANLGRRTAELHAALSSCDDDPAFTPEAFSQDSLKELVDQLRAEVQSTCGLIEQADPIENSVANLPQKISLRANTFLDRMSTFDAAKANVVSIRCHGDYHLGQVLRTVSDFVILDFEGEPDRPFNERRQKRCAMKDVAGMIRSFHYASCTTAVGMLPPPDANITNAEKWQTFWYDNARVGFLAGYKLESEGKPFLPTDDSSFQQLLDLFLIEKVLYELRYEINNRPDWVKIPLAGLNAVLGLIA